MSVTAARFLLFLGEDVDDGSVRAALPAPATVDVARLQDALGRASQLVDQIGPDVLLVGCAAYSEPALQAIADVAANRPDCPIVVLYGGSPNGFMEAAFNAGADDLIMLPLPAAQLAFALEKALARRSSPGSRRDLGQMITILGPKGGTGKTLATCNLAVALAQAGARPVVVDVDLQFGDVGLALGLQPIRTIYDLAVAGGTLDAEKVEAFLLEHPSGARALLAPTRPDQAAAVGIPFLRRLFDLLRGRYDFVIVDTPPAFSPEVIAAVDMSSQLCMVGMLDALSLKNTKIGFETLRQMGYEPDDAILVLNRADTSVGIGQADVHEVLGKTPDVLVPSDRGIPRALTAGRTIVEAEPKSGPARAFSGLAQRYLEEAARPEPAEIDNHRHASQPGLRGALLRKAS